MTAPEARTDILVEAWDAAVAYGSTQALYESDWFSTAGFDAVAVVARSNSNTTVFQVQQAVADPADLTATPGDALWVSLPAATAVSGQGSSTLNCSSLEVPLAARYVRLIAWDPDNAFSMWVSMRGV